jgi:hypothetical protein
MDSKGVEMCLAADSPYNTACNDTTALRLDGTMDHNVYIMPKTEIRENSSTIDKMSYFALQPLYFFFGIVTFLLAISICVILAYALISISGVRPW